MPTSGNVEDSASERNFSDDLTALLPRLRRFAYGLCGSLHDADDIVQSAIERALTRRSQFKPGSRLDSWMFRIIQSVHLNRIRHDAVRQRHVEMSPPAQATGDGGLEAYISLQRVRELIWELPEEQRAVLLLVAVEGCSYKETSEILGVPMGTVTSRLARARGALAERLDAASH
jgi:RNA polymerase sigma-70 factor (ECF subfamily)